ncbi:Crp/Fnr family transcriptional regulator [Actinokineospora sp. NBRC 105648]|uniref:Crp/Fnr family transcriptional regulator n=1 Tax=Actinokineospora sp. NBRC 105648 TaxID=3032206 RepID=UPI002555DE59|nr:Crp/Fnr family transcriptional regulator [Actinokineospora sp. NBRC 105648]
MDRASVTFWELLDDAQRAAVTAAGTVRRFGKGTVIIREGDRGGWVLVLTRGRVKVVAAGPGGHQAVLSVRGPGDMLGEMAALDDRPRSATVTAIEPVTGLVIPPDRLTRLLTEHQSINAVFLRIVTGRLRYANERRLEHGDAGTAQRLASLLVDLYTRYCDTDGETLTLRMSQSELAGLISASREAVTRALRTLREEGVVSTGRQRLVVHDIAALRRAAT